MKFKLQLVMEDEQGKTQVEDVIHLEKNSEHGYGAGLSLLESKQLLSELQRKMVLRQAEDYTESHRACPHCQRQRHSKGYRALQYKTLFGTVIIPSLRLYQCDCRDVPTKTLSVLTAWLPEHTSPELHYIETKWGSHMSYEQTAARLRDVLPVSATQNAATVRNHLHKVAKRQELVLEGKPHYMSGCIREWEKLPKPDKPLTVGIDGGYLKSWRNKGTHFEVIVGKAFSTTRPAKRFGLVQSVDDNPRRRLFHVLTEQGMQANQSITFLSDGAGNIRDLQYCMHPESEHMLDWFHVAMRLTVLNQFAKGLIRSDPNEGEEVKRHLKSTRWYLWHGNVKEALDCLEDCTMLCDSDTIHYKLQKKLLTHLEDMSTYLDNNRHLIPNYGERWRYGEVISSSFVESTVNEVVAKRMVKKQQMQWTDTGAHCLLQARTATLNGDLPQHFKRWYPALTIENEVQKESLQ